MTLWLPSASVTYSVMNWASGPAGSIQTRLLAVVTSKVFSISSLMSDLTVYAVPLPVILPKVLAAYPMESTAEPLQVLGGSVLHRYCKANARYGGHNLGSSTTCPELLAGTTFVNSRHACNNRGTGIDMPCLQK